MQPDNRSVPQTENARDWLKSHYPRVSIPHALNISTRHQAVYVTNPKAACTTIIAGMCRSEVGDQTIPASSIHRDKHLYLPRVTELGVKETLERMLDGSLYVFSLTRNPLTRIASAYSDKIVKHNFADRRQTIQRILGRPEDPEEIVPFGMFLDALELQEPKDMDPHWRPQHINLMSGCLRYDYIGKIEAMAEAMAVLSKRLGFGSPDFRAHHNEARIDVTANPDWVRRIERLYQRDFELFGY